MRDTEIRDFLLEISYKCSYFIGLIDGDMLERKDRFQLLEFPKKIHKGENDTNDRE